MSEDNVINFGAIEDYANSGDPHEQTCQHHRNVNISFSAGEKVFDLRDELEDLHEATILVGAAITWYSHDDGCEGQPEPDEAHCHPVVELEFIEAVAPEPTPEQAKFLAEAVERHHERKRETEEQIELALTFLEMYGGRMADMPGAIIRALDVTERFLPTATGIWEKAFQQAVLSATNQIKATGRKNAEAAQD